MTYDPELSVCFVQHSGAGEWGHPGGTIEKNGETPLEALERELVEETNTQLIKPIPIGYQKVIHPNGEKPEFYQLRYVALVSKIGNFIADPAEPNLICKEIQFSEIPEYIKWGKIGDRIYEQSKEILLAIPKEVSTEKLFRKGVSALIVNKSQELLLVNLQSFETKYYAIPGGGIEEDEALEDAVYREIKEELGIPKESLELVGLSKDPTRLLFKTKKLARSGVEYDGMERFFFGFRFVGNDVQIVLQSEEVRAYKWVAYKDLKDYLLFDGQLEDTSTKLLELFPYLEKE